MLEIPIQSGGAALSPGGHYLSRPRCISVAGPRNQEYLHIGPQQWGWVVGVFAIAYAVFEIPGGWMADRFGPRLILTRIVCGGRRSQRSLVRSQVSMLSC